VDATILTQVATKIETGNGAGFTTQETDVYGRFDLLLNTLLDQAYQRADQRYKNAARAMAVPVAVVLAVVGAYLVFGGEHFTGGNLAVAILAGLISTPIAPIAKDIASALSTAAQAFQVGKK
jgi:ABC-type protease/lipase transport system fused ATPase/permease subunit